MTSQHISSYSKESFLLTQIFLKYLLSYSSVCSFLIQQILSFLIHCMTIAGLEVKASVMETLRSNKDQNENLSAVISLEIGVKMFL